MPGASQGRVVVGATREGWLLTRPEHSVLVIGPPRSGKTTGLIVPNVMAAEGPVLCTSTKPDVLTATADARGRMGRCWLYDPTGQTPVPAGVEQLRWSPIATASRWDGAVLAAEAMVGAARPYDRGDAVFWSERATALLAPVLHAAALGRSAMDEVVSWVDRRDPGPALEILETAGVRRGFEVLSGVTDADHRELSGVWSTAAGVLAAYRLDSALSSAGPPNFDPDAFVRSRDTVYVCAPGRHQAVCAPLVVGLIDQIRDARYALGAGAAGTGALGAGSVGTGALGSRSPGHYLLLALDEVANIAPLPGLARLVSEGGSQGVVTVACLQDLSQARGRWGTEADGFLTLFGTKVLLPGVADVRTLEALSNLAGRHEVPVRSTTRRGWRRADTTWSTRHDPRLPVDVLRAGRDGRMLVIDGERPPVWVGRAGPAGIGRHRPGPGSPDPALPATRNGAPLTRPVPTREPRGRER